MQRVVRTAGIPEEPLLSVVMPVYNTETFVRDALSSVLEQSYRNLEVVVVDDGSIDRSMDIVRELAARDPRVRVVSQPNAGLGAARNTGWQNARGHYLTFCDADDLVLPGAYEAMMSGLCASGSDFAAGNIVRGDESHATRPDWMARVMDRDELGLTIARRPEMLLDITAPNKVFRRSFWRRAGLHFPEGVRYEDQVPITTALLRARSFDIHRRNVYLWRMRLDGTSISQQKASIEDLRDRLRSQVDIEALLLRQPEAVREFYYLKLLDYDLPPYMDAATKSEAEYVEMLCARLETIRLQAPAQVWARIAFPNRALGWLLSERRHEEAGQLKTWLQRQPGGRPTSLVGDDLLYVLPFSDNDLDLPTSLLQVQQVDVRPVVRLTEVRWEGSELVLRGSAFLYCLDHRTGTHDLSLTLVDTEDKPYPVPITRFTDPRLDALSQRAFQDCSHTGFEARVDASRLAGAAPRGQRSLRLEFVHRQHGYEGHSSVTHVQWFESGGAREPREVGGRMVRLAGNLATGLRVLVEDSWAMVREARSMGPKVELDIAVPTTDPAVSCELVSSDGPDKVPVEPVGPGRHTLTLRPVETDAKLVIRHRSGRHSTVLWTQAPSVVGDEDGAFVHRGEVQGVNVGARQPAVLVSQVTPQQDVLVLSGTSFGATGLRLAMAGERAVGSASEPLPNGPFEVKVPLTTDPWGRGAVALPAGRYELTEPSGQPLRCRVVGGLRDTLPFDWPSATQHLQLGVSGEWNLLVFSASGSEWELSQRRKEELRSVVYPAAREAARRAVVLLESFGGRSTGDSPADIGAELVRRGADLDVVWSVIDGSVDAPQGTRAVIRESQEWFDLLGSAAYLVNNNNFPWYFQKAPGQVYLQAWHGTPLKRIGNDIPDLRYMSLSYLRTMADEALAWDYLISPSPYCTEIFPRAFGYDGPVLESGYPRNDMLAGPERDTRRAEVRRRLALRDDQQVVLYAPTWRDSARSRDGRYSKVLHLDPDEVVEAVPDSVVLVRGHSNTARSGAVASRHPGRVMDVTLYPDVNDLFLASDALVTDYSSVMFDYAVLDRPMLFLVPDLHDYRDRLRGFYFDFETDAPGPLCPTQETLIKHLRELRGGTDEQASARAAFRERFAPWDDGHAAARVVDAVFDGTTP